MRPAACGRRPSVAADTERWAEKRSMSEPYNLPSANVVSVLVANDVVTTTIEISNESYLGYPIAPADLRRPKTH
jgi:hypothetical protein